MVCFGPIGGSGKDGYVKSDTVPQLRKDSIANKRLEEYGGNIKGAKSRLLFGESRDAAKKKGVTPSQLIQMYNTVQGDKGKLSTSDMIQVLNTLNNMPKQ